MLRDQLPSHLRGGSAEGDNPRELLRHIRETLDQAQKEAADSQLRLEAALREQDEWRQRGLMKSSRSVRASAVVLEAQKALERARKFREEQLCKKHTQQQIQDLASPWPDCLAEVVREPQEVFDISADQQPGEVSEEISFKWLSLASKGVNEQKRSRESKPMWNLSESSLEYVEGTQEKLSKATERTSDFKETPRAKVTPRKDLEVRCSVEKIGSQKIEPTPKKPHEVASPVSYVPFMYPVPMFQPVFSPYYTMMPPGNFWNQTSPTLKTPRKRTLEKTSLRQSAKKTVIEEVSEERDRKREVRGDRRGEDEVETRKDCEEKHERRIEERSEVQSRGEHEERREGRIEQRTVNEKHEAAEELGKAHPVVTARGELVVLDNPEATSLSEAFQAHCRPATKSTTRVGVRREKSREELVQIRKQLLKPRSQAKLPPQPETLKRLVQGQRTPISKKEMLALTARNYKQLPEVRMKHEDEERKEALLQRLASAKAYARREKTTSC